jgi:hypothetical protein
VASFFDFPQSRSKSRAVQYVIREPVSRVARGMLEEVGIDLQRNRRIGVTEPMLGAKGMEFDIVRPLGTLDRQPRQRLSANHIAVGSTRTVGSPERNLFMKTS